MSKDQQTSVVVLPLTPAIAEIDGLIKVGGVDEVARNLNTSLANRSPCYVMQQCAGGASSRYIEVTDASPVRRYTWAVPPCQADYRRTMRGVVEYETGDGSTTAEITLASIIGGGSEVNTLAASTGITTADLYTGTLALAATGVDFELVSASMERSAGSGTVKVRSISLWHDVATGAVTDGIGIGADLTLLGADSALTPAALKQVSDGQAQADATWYMPVACHCVDGAGTKNGWRTDDEDFLARVAGPMQVYPRIGEGVETLRFALFPYVSTGCTANFEVRAELADSSTPIDIHTETGVATGADIETPADWLTGLLTVPNVVGSYYTITIRARVASGTGTVGLVSWALWSDTA